MTYNELRRDPRVLLTGAGLFGMRPALALGGAGDRLALCAIRAGHAAPNPDTVIVAGIGVPYEKLSSSPDHTPRYLFRRGSFRKSLAERRDLPILFDYSSARILGRTGASATATIFESERGVEFQCQPPDTQWASDLLVSLQRKDISGCGIAAVIVRRHNELRDGEQVVVVDEANLITISISSFPQFDCGLQVHNAASSAAAATTSKFDRDFLKAAGIVSAGRV